MVTQGAKASGNNDIDQTLRNNPDHTSEEST